MPNSFLFVILVAIAGAFWINSQSNLSSTKKKKILPQVLGVGVFAAAVAQPIQDPKNYVSSLALLAATYFLCVRAH